jgi:hypothetical protein
MRDYWWEVVKMRKEYIIKTGKFQEENFTEIDPKSRHLLKRTSTAIYHVIMPKDTFEDAAQAIFASVFLLQKNYPNQERMIVIDIEGHRNKQGGFDHDMFELQCYFNLNIILPYVTRIFSPLACVENKYPQINEIPEELNVFGHEEAKTLVKGILKFNK